MKWDAEKEAKLKAMALYGLAYSDAALYFGVSRSAIASIAYRKRIKFVNKIGSIGHLERSTAAQRERRKREVAR